MKILVDTYTIKQAKRNDLSNPITAALHNVTLSAMAYGCYVDKGDDVDDHICSYVFGSITRRKQDTERAKSILKLRSTGIPIFSLDSGLFSTYVRRKTNSSESNFFRIGLNDCVGTGDFLNKESSPERYEWFKKAYGFEEKDPVKDRDGWILFLLQTERGWQYDELIPYKDWARQTLLEIRKHTDKTVVLRAHPNHAREPLEYIGEGVPDVIFQYGERARQSSIEAIRYASCVVTHSSSAAMEAYIEGVPVFALDKRCLGYEHFSHSLQEINNLNDYNWSNRYQNLCDWANTTWHIDELKNPKLLEYYLKKAKLI